MRSPACRISSVLSLGLSLSLLTSGELLSQLPAPPASFPGFVTNIEQATIDNQDFRRVIFTTQRTQLALMSLLPGENIGMETHASADQFVRVESGTGQAILNGQVQPISDGSAVVIPAGTQHDVVNTGSVPLKFYVLYSAPLHPPGTVERTKQEAEAARHNH